MPTVGLKDLHYAKITKDDGDSFEYDQPKYIAPAISANIEPQVNNANFHGDDALLETIDALDSINVALNSDDLPPEVQEDLLGAKVNSDGVIESAINDQAPYVALGFKAQKANGKYRFVWLLKGRFRPASRNYQTKEATPAFQTPTHNATFLGRKKDGKWKFEVEEDQENVAQEVIDDWFDSVYQPTPQG
ncbi:major tail protein [Evansella cellulosilytica]|uniref:Phage major tail protein, phi13 family n=1 Tax=Evansella cellulosilytica (strain ATCC 21833 / DSM 2522 / FERM P-1141 / JCM 9156 / N-4) TaxID=649639 RepID=E6TVG2_EVAC2|nr:major tail protein [Evansella cellulosilytica]ADU30979.1 phage major tail protein, phi13 family [Evansella cellulosilytica DSM 2522]